MKRRLISSSFGIRTHAVDVFSQQTPEMFGALPDQSQLLGRTARVWADTVEKSTPWATAREERVFTTRIGRELHVSQDFPWDMAAALRTDSSEVPPDKVGDLRTVVAVRLQFVRQGIHEVRQLVHPYFAPDGPFAGKRGELVA
jgi:hypothetical protein